MKVSDLVSQFGMEVAAGAKGLDRTVKNGYCGDLLSEVMANASEGCVWLTVQGHQNVVAIAVLKELAAIIITGGHAPDGETVQKAEEEGIPILQWPGSSFDLAGRISAMGVGNSEKV